MRASEAQSFDAMRASRRLSHAAAARWTVAFRIVAGLLVALATAVCVSGARNLSDVVEAHGAMSEFVQSSAESVNGERWQYFDGLWLAANRAGETPDVLKRLGLFQGIRLRWVLERVYYRAAAQMLVNPLLTTLERSFDAEGSPNRSTLNDRRLYQMLHRRPGCELDEALFGTRSVALFRATAHERDDHQSREIANRHLAMLAHRERFARIPHDELLAWRQAYATAAPHSDGGETFDRAYSALIAEPGLSPVQLIDVLNGETSRGAELLDGFRQVMLGDTTVEGAFGADQRAAMQRSVSAWRTSAADACLGSPGPSDTHASEGEGQPTARYVADYVDRWKRVLKQTRVKQFGLADAPRHLTVLAGDRSPLVATLAFVARNTAVDPTASPAEAPEMTQALMRAFSPVQKVVPAGDERWMGGWINEAYRKSLLDLRDAAAAFASEPQNADARRRLREVAAAGVSAVDLLPLPPGSDGVDRMVKDLLKAPFELTRSRVPENGGSEMNAMLAALCRDVSTVRGRMAAQSNGTPQEAAAVLDSVTALYHPATGSYLRFANSGYVTRGANADEWVPGPQAGGVTLDTAFLQFISRLSATSRALFADGTTLGFDYLVDIVPMPSDMSVSLMSGGTAGRSEGAAIRLSWPGVRPEEGLVLKTPGTSVAYTGPQGLFDLARYNGREAGDRVIVSKARLPGGGVVELQHAGGPASVDLRVRGVPGGLDGIWMSPSCPSRAARQ